MDDYLSSGVCPTSENDGCVSSPLPILDIRRLVLSLDDLNSRKKVTVRRTLTPAQRQEIIAKAFADHKVNLRALARQYDVSRETIARALGRRKRSDGTFVTVLEIPRESE